MSLFMGRLSKYIKAVIWDEKVVDIVNSAFGLVGLSPCHFVQS